MSHNYSCVAKWPDCPCNSCAHDSVDGELCCDKHGKRCYMKKCKDYEEDCCVEEEE